MNNNQWWRPFAGTLVGVAAGSFVVLMAWMIVTVLSVVNSIETLTKDSARTTTQIRHTQKSSRKVLDFVNDCTKPKGKCYQESQAQQAEQAGALNAAVIAAAWCSLNLPDPTLHELTVCVGKRLDGKKER